MKKTSGWLLLFFCSQALAVNVVVDSARLQKPAVQTQNSTAHITQVYHMMPSGSLTINNVQYFYDWQYTSAVDWVLIPFNVNGQASTTIPVSQAGIYFISLQAILVHSAGAPFAGGLSVFCKNPGSPSFSPGGVGATGGNFTGVGGTIYIHWTTSPNTGCNLAAGGQIMVNASGSWAPGQNFIVVNGSLAITQIGP